MKDKILKSGDKIIIREIVPNDAEKMLEYLKIIGGETPYLTFGEEGLPVTIEQEREIIKQMHDDKNMHFLCADKNGEIIASVNVRWIAKKRLRHSAEFGISVKKKYWRNGIGRLLLEEIIQICKENGIRKLNLKVIEGNERAMNLYKSFGFVIEGKITREHCIDGVFQDAYCMGLEID